MGINRHEINRVIFFDQALEGQNTVLPGSPLYREDYQKSYTRFDLDAANALLDEMGLKRTWDGTRLRPDGDPLEIIVETSGLTEHSDVLELISDSWWQLGIKIFIKPLGKETLRRRIFSGQTQMTLYSGFDNGLATADMAPGELAPITQVQYQWSDWGEYYETNGNAGSPPDMDLGHQLMALRAAWYQTANREERSEIWHKMLELHADNLPSIGIVSGVLQPIVVRNGLRNLPVDGLWNWNPGSHFGFYGLDHLYWDEDVTAGTTRK
jgi:peptide/nickel transport system substrate-binding protein